jgi:hypothetical protein
LALRGNVFEQYEQQYLSRLRIVIDGVGGISFEIIFFSNNDIFGGLDDNDDIGVNGL